MRRQSASRIMAVLTAAFSGGIVHSIGMRSSAVLAWYQVSAITATPPLKMRPRVQRRVGNRELDGGTHAGHVADGVEVVALHVAAVDGHALTAAHFMPGRRTSIP